MPKVITISEEAYEALKKIKGNRSFSQVILSLTKNKKKKYSKRDTRMAGKVRKES